MRQTERKACFGYSIDGRWCLYYVPVVPARGSKEEVAKSGVLYSRVNADPRELFLRGIPIGLHLNYEDL